MIELFSANTPNAWKISIMHEEIDYEYKVSPVDIYNKEQFKELFIGNKNDVHKNMLDVTRSDKENWTKTGFFTAGFWSRWLLWSHPELEGAKKIISKKFDLSFL